MASLAEITEAIREAVRVDPGLGKTLKLDLRGDGCIFLDGSAVSNEDRDADCTSDLSGGVVHRRPHASLAERHGTHDG